MRLAVAATPEIAIAPLEKLLTSKHAIVRIFTQPDRPAGRGRRMQSSPVADWARHHQIELHQPESPDEMAAHLSDVECVITIGFGVLLPEKILTIPRRGFLNVHFSLLPRWRGAAPVQRSIEAGDQVTGVSVFALDKGMDTGPIYVQASINLQPQWNTGKAMEVLSSLGADALIEALTKIEDGILPIAQEESGATRARKLTHAEGKIDWQRPADEILRKVRAFTPHPGAWTMWREKVLKIEEAQIATEDSHLPPGSIHIEDGKVFVGTSHGELVLTLVRPAGKNSMEVHDWLNGARLKEGELLG